MTLWQTPEEPARISRISPEKTSAPNTRKGLNQVCLAQDGHDDTAEDGHDDTI